MSNRGTTCGRLVVASGRLSTGLRRPCPTRSILAGAGRRKCGAVPAAHVNERGPLRDTVMVAQSAAEIPTCHRSGTVANGGIVQYRRADLHEVADLHVGKKLGYGCKIHMVAKFIVR